MKPKILLLAALALLVGVGLWWFTRPAESAPQKTSPTPTSVKTEAPKPATPSQQIAAPTAPPVQTKPSTAATAKAEPPVDANDPQADLKTAIPDMARLARARDNVALLQTYSPPDKLDPALLQKIRTMQSNIEASISHIPDFRREVQETFDAQAAAFEALLEQTPAYNAGGDEATYQYTDPVLHGQSSMIFVKINGKWYVKSGL